MITTYSKEWVVYLCQTHYWTPWQINKIDPIPTNPLTNEAHHPYHRHNPNVRLTREKKFIYRRYSDNFIEYFIIKVAHVHHNLQRDTYRDRHLYACLVPGHCAWFKCMYVHREAQIRSNMDGFLLLKKMSSFFPSSVWPEKGTTQFQNKLNNIPYRSL